MNVKIDVLISVFQMVSECRKKNEYCKNRAERNPFTSISPDELNRILRTAKANGKDAYEIVSFAISIAAGILDEGGVYKLNCANRGNLIIQAEYLKSLTDK